MNAIDVTLKEVEILTIRVLDGLHEQKDMERLSVLLSSSAVARSRYAELVIQDSGRVVAWIVGDQIPSGILRVVPFLRIALLGS